MLQKSTLQLLRFHFSFFLMPVYWFALSQTMDVDFSKAVLIFVILHLFLYPASNGYNSYMDRDTGPIGGLAKPMAPSRQLFWVTIFLDVAGLLLGLLVSKIFFAGALAFILASRAYSYRGIRLKKYPILGYLTVVIFQGALIYFIVKQGAGNAASQSIPWLPMLASALLVGSFYPLTQIYQHKQDAEDGVISISARLGYKGTFIFTGIIFSLAMMALAWYFGNQLELDSFFILQIFMLPSVVYFFWWMRKVYINVASANYQNTMRMNIVTSICTNAGFMFILLNQKY